MSINYDPSSNKVTITGYTEATPGNFSDIVAADRAGEFSLHTRTGITGTDASGVTVDQALRPCEYFVLGGTRNDLYIVVTNWNATSATIKVLGTDAAGNAQEEDIDITGNGAYPTVNLYRTVTHTQVTAFLGTSFDYDLRQGMWGVIWNLGNGQYQLDARLVIGDGSTSTYFTETRKQIVFNGITSSWQDHIEIKANATLVFGTLNDADKRDTKDGCSLHFGTGYSGYLRNNGGTCYIYSSHLFSDVSYLYISNLTRFWNCVCHKGISILEVDDSYRITISDTIYGFRGVKTGDVIEDVVIYDANDGIRSPKAGVQNVKGYNLSGDLFAFDITNPNDSWALDCYTDGSFVDITSSNFTGTFYQQFTLVLKIRKGDGTPMSGAVVDLIDNSNNKVWDGLVTDANGDITANGEDGSPFDNAISYKSYYYSGGMQTETYGPWTLVVTKPGYEPYRGILDIDHKLDLEIVLGLHRAKRYVYHRNN